MKKNIIIINVGRGPILNQADLYHFLANNPNSSAAIDTWYEYNPEEYDGKRYPYDLNYPFHELENMILSPHRAGSPMSHISRWDEHINNIITFANCRIDQMNNVVSKTEGY